jgi:hypothetical protein
LDQASKPTYYGLASYYKNARRKERVEGPLEFVASCGPQAFSTHDKELLLNKDVKNNLEC